MVRPTARTQAILHDVGDHNACVCFDGAQSGITDYWFRVFALSYFHANMVGWEMVMRRTNMGPLVTVLFGVACIAVAISLLVFTMSGNHAKIESWAEENDYVVVSIDETFFDYGPFWVKHDGQHIYRVVLCRGSKERTSYFRTGIFGMDQEWGEE